MTEVSAKLRQDAARSIVTMYLKIRPGENVVIESWDHTLPMAATMVDEVRRAGGRTLHIHEDEEAWWRAIDRKQGKLLGNTSESEWAALKAADVYMHFWGPGDTDRIEKLPEKTFDETLAWFSPWYESARKAGLRGARVTLGFATEGRAKQWGVDRGRWEESILRACLTDPVKMAKSARRLFRALSTGSQVRITHPNGTDVKVALAGTPPRIHDGTPHPRDRRYGESDMLGQIPGGRIDVALDSRTAEGRFRANRRTNIWWYWSSGGNLEFADGRLRSYSFENGEEEFARSFKSGTPGKDRTGYLMIGLNPAVGDVPNLETVELGSITLSVGRNGHLKGKNRTNFMNWVTLAGAEISVDEVLVVKDGKLL